MTVRKQKLKRFKNTAAEKLVWVERIARQRLGLRQPSAALPPQDRRSKSGRGLPQSKTSRNYPNMLSNCAFSFIEIALSSRESCYIFRNRKNELSVDGGILTVMLVGPETYCPAGICVHGAGLPVRLVVVSNTHSE